MIHIDLSSIKKNEDDDKDNYVGIRMNKTEHDMLSNLLDKLNIETYSELIRLLIRTAFEQTFNSKN